MEKHSKQEFRKGDGGFMRSNEIDGSFSNPYYFFSNWLLPYTHLSQDLRVTTGAIVHHRRLTVARPNVVVLPAIAIRRNRGEDHRSKDNQSTLAGGLNPEPAPSANDSRAMKRPRPYVEETPLMASGRKTGKASQGIDSTLGFRSSS